MTIDAAAAGCSKTLTGADADAAWQAAFDAVQVKLGDGCRRVDVHVSGGHATVVYVALDGRVAIRRIDAPADLEPAIDALRVSLPAKAVQEAEPPKPAEKPPAAAALVAPPPNRPAFGAAVALYGGMRIGFPGAFVSPLLGTSANLSLGAWSIGVYGEWETSYDSRSNPLPQGYQLSAVAAGVTVGRYFFDRALLVDARIGGAVVSEERNEEIEIPHDERAEPRLGLHARTSFPASSPIRMRVGLGLDIAPVSASQRTIDPSLPTAPAIGLTLSLGFEGDASGAP